MTIARESLLRIKPVLLGLVLVCACAGALHAQAPAPATAPNDRFQRMSREAEARGLAEPFKGITTNGQIIPGLFGIRSTGVSTEPVRTATDEFIATLTSAQRQR